MFAAHASCYRFSGATIDRAWLPVMCVADLPGAFSFVVTPILYAHFYFLLLIKKEKGG